MNKIHELPNKSLDTAILVGFQGGAVFELGDHDVYIGRSSENEVAIIGDLSLSRRHALISKVDEAYYVRDLKSSNGTFVNGIKVHGVMALQPDDEIFCGKTTLVFQPGKAKLRSMNWKTDQAITSDEGRGGSSSVWNHDVLKAMLALVKPEFSREAPTTKLRNSNPCRDLPKAV